MAITENLLRDTALVESIIQYHESEYGISESTQYGLTIDDVKRYLQLAIAQGIEAARAEFSEPEANRLEAVVLKVGRPAILIENNTFQARTDEWGTRLEAARAHIEKAIAAVGRIEMSNHPQGILYDGTGWLVAPDIIITNSHVARQFGLKTGSTFSFKSNKALSKAIRAQVDFREEYRVDKEEQFEALEVIYLNESENPDIAFLRISRNSLRGGVIATLQAKPIPLASTTIKSGAFVAAIGYPKKDSARNPLPDAEMDKIFDDIYDVKRLQPGQIMKTETELLTHDCSTLGGNSGSVLLNLATGEAIGIHYGGEFLKGNWAIPSQVIQKLMDKIGA
jgi:endonuclease G, mitochondrial